MFKDNLHNHTGSETHINAMCVVYTDTQVTLYGLDVIMWLQALKRAHLVSIHTIYNDLQLKYINS